MKLIASLGIPAFAALLAYAAGVTLTLGAHPWWADKVIWIGLPVGLALAGLAWALRLSWMTSVTGFALLTLTAGATARIGKTRFAASFAEDTVGGLMWYYGWIAVCALSAATLASLFRDRHQTR